MEFALSGVGVPPTNSRFREGLCLRREKSPALHGVPAGRDECKIGLGVSPKVCWAVSAQEKTYA